tara:strand:- start:252 stop:611 length:360 start_codon:yes stop_codon:yes gene_type:complete
MHILPVKRLETVAQRAIYFTGRNALVERLRGLGRVQPKIDLKTVPIPCPNPAILDLESFLIRSIDDVLDVTKRDLRILLPEGTEHDVKIGKPVPVDIEVELLGTMAKHQGEQLGETYGR